MRSFNSQRYLTGCIRYRKDYNLKIAERNKTMFSVDFIKQAAKDKKPFLLEHAIVKAHCESSPAKRFWNKSFKLSEPRFFN